jgi:hypothetical protein
MALKKKRLQLERMLEQEAQLETEKDDAVEDKPTVVQRKKDPGYIDLIGYSMIDILDIYYETPERISPEMQTRIMHYLQAKRDARASTNNWMR